MIDTIQTRMAQLQDGFFHSGTGPIEILIVGSCRTIAFLNYLVRWNATRNQFTIRRIDPCDMHWNADGMTVDVNAVLSAAEKDDRILSVLRSSKIFIHEHIANYAMFNTSRDLEKNIYQFGMNPEIDIAIPNWHDTFVLYNDFVDFNALTDDWAQKGEAAIQKVCDLCKLTSFPEMGDYIHDNWRDIRFFWRPNHTSAAYTLKIFRLMNDKFLHLDLTQEFWDAAGQEDLFRDPHTHLTQQDIDAYRITWR